MGNTHFEKAYHFGVRLLLVSLARMCRYLVEHFPWFHRCIPPREGGIVRDLECVVDAIIKTVEDCTLYIHIQLPIIFSTLEARVDGCLFCPPNGWLCLVCWLPHCIEDWISLCVDNGNLGRIINRKQSRIHREPERCCREESIHGPGHYKSGPSQNVALRATYAHKGALDVSP